MDNAKHNYKKYKEKYRELIRNKELKPMEKLLMIDILEYAGNNSAAFPSQGTLADDLGCKPRHIRDCLYVLLAHGWLKNWKRRGYGKSNVYYPNEALHYHNDESDRQYGAAQTGDVVPYHTGIAKPTNVNQLNKSSNVINKRYSSLDDVSDEDVRDIATQYKVPEGLVRLQLEALRNYCSAKGKRYKNYKAALRNFVLREAKSQIERRDIYGSKRGIDATGI